MRLTRREKCPFSPAFYWSVFSHIPTEYGVMRSISPYSVQIRQNKVQKNSKYGLFLRSVRKDPANSLSFWNVKHSCLNIWKEEWWCYTHKVSYLTFFSRWRHKQLKWESHFTCKLFHLCWVTILYSINKRLSWYMRFILRYIINVF